MAIVFNFKILYMIIAQRLKLKGFQQNDIIYCGVSSNYASREIDELFLREIKGSFVAVKCINMIGM